MIFSEMPDQVIGPAASITHQHVVAVINTCLSAEKRKHIRILDVGCGNGLLLSHMLDALPRLQPKSTVSVHGLDVTDAGQQQHGYMDKTRNVLSSNHPSIDWENGLRFVSSTAPWPYEDDQFDFITTNQVLEHVHDLNFVFSEMHRCLRGDGVAVNLFPTREILWEGHALMPIVHRIEDTERRELAMYLLSKAGFRKHYRREMERRGWTSLKEFARVFSRVLETDTCYRSSSEITRIARLAGFEASFDFTKDFIAAKLASFIGRRRYTYSRIRVLEKLGYLIGRRLTSSTMVLRKLR